MRKRAGRASRAWRGATLALVGLAGFATGCSSETPPIILQLPTANGQGGPLVDVSSCGPHDIDIIDRVCLIDSNGRTYPAGGLPILPEAAPYAGYFQFHPGFVPLAQDLDSTSDDPAINVLASTTWPCCADPNTTIRPPVQVTTTPEGGLLIAITDTVSVGSVGGFTLFFPTIYKHLTDPCTLPDPVWCNPMLRTGFGMGFYVGAKPPGAP